MSIVLAVFMMLGIADRQTFAGGDDDAAVAESRQLISEEESTEIPSSPEAIESGETLFFQACAYCHGARGVGGKARRMQCLDVLTADYVYDVISNGKQSGAFIMPSWKDSYDKKTRWQLVAYIMTLKDLPKCKK